MKRKEKVRKVRLELQSEIKNEKKKQLIKKEEKKLNEKSNIDKKNVCV